jgi:hypothetical protein
VENDVGVVAEVGVEGVILKVGRVEMVACILIASVLSNESLEVVEGEEVRIVPTGSLKGD